ncbi:MAG TPA: tetratricopeptide repeat protein, partial [Candidatus Methylomirabilis sp.]
MQTSAMKDPRYQMATVVTDEDLLQTIRERRPDKLFRMGKALLERDRARDAITALELAYQASPTEPLYMSYLGLAAAMNRSPAHNPIKLCETAARQEFFKAELLNNLGRVYLMSGKRRKAYEAFRKGVEVDSNYFLNLECLQAM